MLNFSFFFSSGKPYYRHIEITRVSIMRRVKQVSTKMVYEVPTGAPIRWQVNVAGQLSACMGQIWLTRESDPADYWLSADRPLAVQPGEVLWVGVEGDKPGRLELRFEADAPRRPSTVWQSWGRALGRVIPVPRGTFNGLSARQ